MWHLLNYRGMNGNATIMLRAGEVLLKSFKTANLPTFGCSLCPFRNCFCCSHELWCSRKSRARCCGENDRIWWLLSRFWGSWSPQNNEAPSHAVCTNHASLCPYFSWHYPVSFCCAGGHPLLVCRWFYLFVCLFLLWEFFFLCLF